MPYAKVAFGNIIDADLVVNFAVIVFVAGHSNGNNIGIARVMEQSVGIMHGTIYCKRVDVFKIRLVFSRFVFHLPGGI